MANSSTVWEESNASRQQQQQQQLLLLCGRAPLEHAQRANSRAKCGKTSSSNSSSSFLARVSSKQHVQTQSDLTLRQPASQTNKALSMRIDMKMEKMSQKALERKSNKPIMEKKRRARINHCLNQLKSLILETDNERSRHSKLEKADILEMTVRYLQTLRAYHLHLTNLQHLQQQPLQAQPQPQQQQPAHMHHFQSQHQHQLPKLQLQLPLQLQASHQSPQQIQTQISPAWRPW